MCLSPFFFESHRLIGKLYDLKLPLRMRTDWRFHPGRSPVLSLKIQREIGEKKDQFMHLVAKMRAVKRRKNHTMPDCNLAYLLEINVRIDNECICGTATKVIVVWQKG